MQTLGPQTLNTTRSYALTLSGPGGASLAGAFDGTEAFRAILWAGDDRAPLWTSEEAVAWDADIEGNPAELAAPVLVLDVPRAAVEGLPEGTYRLQVLIDPDDGDVEAFSGHLRLVAAAGAAAARPAYCTYEDLTREAPWIGDLQDLGEDQAGFAEQRADAREEFDQVLQRHYRGTASLGGAYRVPGIGGTGSWRRRTGRLDEWLQGELDADHLVLAGPSGRKVVRINALLALARVLRPQIGGSHGGTSYQALGARFAALAEDLMASTVAELDTNEDEVGDVTIDLGAVDVLRG